MWSKYSEVMFILRHAYKFCLILSFDSKEPKSKYTYDRRQLLFSPAFKFLAVRTGLLKRSRLLLRQQKAPTEILHCLCPISLLSYILIFASLQYWPREADEG